MRRRAKVDANQREVVEAMRAAGASVLHLHSVGGGCPDVLVGYRGDNYLVEIKDGGKSPSRRKLRDNQAEWHAAWRGSVHVIEDAETAAQWVRSL